MLVLGLVLGLESRGWRGWDRVQNFGDYRNFNIDNPQNSFEHEDEPEHEHDKKSPRDAGWRLSLELRPDKIDQLLWEERLS